jgi:phage terminase large subunit-like protein
VAEKLGTPLMPWQRYVADVALEVDPETGELAYGEIGLTVPRQSGKTTLWLALMVHRALAFGPPAGPRQNILYTAQTRNDARKKFEDEHVKVLEGSSLRRLFRTRMTNGSEAILWRNGSKHSITSTTEKAGHGETLDLGVVDEAFSHVDDRVEQAMKPAMVTRRNAQFGWTSTAGNAASTYLLSKVELGRATVETGLTRGLCFFEWGADPLADPADPATWRDCMPALGLTAQLSAVANFQRTMKANEFRRAFLNIADTEAAPDAVVDAATWAALADPRSAPQDPVVFAADVTPARDAAAIAVAGGRADERLHVEVVGARRGVDWVVPRLIELHAKWRPCAVVVDAAGPAGSLIAPLERAGIEVFKPSAREAAQACGQFYDAATGDGLRHRDQAELNSALAGAQRRPLGDAWAWARKNSSTDISPLVAATLAMYGHARFAHVPTEAAEPWVMYA